MKHDKRCMKQQSKRDGDRIKVTGRQHQAARGRT